MSAGLPNQLVLKLQWPEPEAGYEGLNFIFTPSVDIHDLAIRHRGVFMKELLI